MYNNGSGSCFYDSTVAGCRSSKKNKKVQLNKSKLTMRVGEKFQLKLKNNKKKVTWTTSKKTVATVNKKGKVTAKKKGSAKITAKVAKKKYICKVTVQNKKKPVAPTPNVVAPTAVPVTDSLR